MSDENKFFSKLIRADLSALLCQVCCYRKPCTSVRGALRVKKSQNKPHTEVCGETQGLFDAEIIDEKSNIVLAYVMLPEEFLEEY